MARGPNLDLLNMDINLKEAYEMMFGFKTVDANELRDYILGSEHDSFTNRMARELQLWRREGLPTLSEQDVPSKPAPIPLLLWCPGCHTRHLDTGEWATRPHHTHACQECGLVWRPSVLETVGVKFLPHFKNEEP